MSAGGPSTSQIRQGFLGLLTKPPISGILSALTPASTIGTWQSHGDGRRTDYAAILASGDVTAAPSAWARLQLPTSDQLSFGWDPRWAGFILHVDWTTPAESAVRPPVDLPRWTTIMSQVLLLPAAIASYLTEKLGLRLKAEPMPAVGFWLSTSSDLSQLIDLAGFTQVGGSRLSRWYDAYAVADNNGQAASVVAQGWITQLCDDALHLDGYEYAI